MKLERVGRKVIPLKGKELNDKLTPEYGAQREKVLNRLIAYDMGHGLSDRARDIAKEEGALEGEYEEEFGDFGRRLSHYGEIQHLLLDPDHLGKVRGKTIVHMGAGNGVYAKYLKDRGANALAVDIGAKAIKIAKRVGADVIRADGRSALPLADGSVDAFVSDRFMFSGEDRLEGKDMKAKAGSWALLKEMGRALRSGGVVVIDNALERPDEISRKRLREAGFELVHGENRKHSWENRMVLRKL